MTESEQQDATVVAEVVYVVQIEDQLLLKDVGEGEGPGGGVVWSDIATVKVPPRTKRSTVIKQALREAGILPNADGTKPKLRALDVDSAEVHEPEAHQPAAEWRL